MQECKERSGEFLVRRECSQGSSRTKHGERRKRAAARERRDREGCGERGKSIQGRSIKDSIKDADMHTIDATCPFSSTAISILQSTSFHYVNQ